MSLRPIVRSAGFTTRSLRPSSLGVLVVLLLPALAQAQVKGTVKFAGTPPKPAELVMKSDPFCAKHKAVDETILINAKGGMKNVVVRIAKGLTGEFPVPASEVVLDQVGCTYTPRVSVAIGGQTVAIKNSDQTLHNVHTYKGAATLFNQAQPQGFIPIKKKFTSGDIVRFKCDVHPWMTAWVAVVDNPFFAISDESGAFSIANVPPGKYTLEAWHEKLGTQTSEIEVKAGKPVEVNFEFK